jgi:arginase
MNVPSDKIAIISYASGIGAGKSGCAKGPIQLQHSPYLKSLQPLLDWQSPLTPTQQLQGMAALASIADLSNQLAQTAADLTRQKRFFLTLGGDHSSAIGTWSGVATAIAPQSLGLIWIDAHLDSHTPDTTPSGNIHGMPLAALLGAGPTELTHILTTQTKLKPENVCIIGVRSFEPAEKHFLEEMNVRIYYMDEIKTRGIDTVFEEALAHVRKNSNYLGVSIDLDAIDPQSAPGVGSPEPDGIDPEALYQGLAHLLSQKELLAAEIVEYNPELDKHHETEQIAVTLIEKFVLNRARGKK